MNAFGISELSKRSGIELNAVRCYERAGLLTRELEHTATPKRYDLESVRRVKFVHRCKELSFSTGEIKELLSLVDGERYTCSSVRKTTLDHAHRIRQKIDDLVKIEASLRSMAARCGAGHVPKCAIIESLFDSY